MVVYQAMPTTLTAEVKQLNILQGMLLGATTAQVRREIPLVDALMNTQCLSGTASPLAIPIKSGVDFFQITENQTKLLYQSHVRDIQV